jgi:hypothetical protein
MKTIEIYPGRIVQAYQEADLPMLRHAGLAAEHIWLEEWERQGCHDEGSCCLGKGFEVYFLPPRAKRPQTMTLYAQNTDLSFLDHEGHPLAQTIEAGGVPMQQAISALMAESGQLMRREKSFEGIEFDAATSYDVDTANADAAANTLAVIRDFDENFAQQIVQAITSARNSGGGNQRYSSTGFASVMHNLIDQALTAEDQRRYWQILGRSPGEIE